MHTVKKSPLYKNPNHPIANRVEDLLKRMTLDEKISQLGCIVGVKQLTEDFKQASLSDGIGEVVLMGDIMLESPENIAKIISEMQMFLVEQTRLGIPAILHIEALAGAMYSGATNFPIPLAASATWHPELVEEMAGIIRQQMLSVGYRQALSPVMDIARDPRWGRIGETYGEDPYLVSSMSVAFVRGLQTANLKDGVVATAKHFLGYGASEGALNMATQHINDRELYEVYARPFEAAIQEACLACIMNSYGEIDGVPIISSRKILTTFLREMLKFKGFTVSDYISINRLVSPHLVAEDMKKAGMMALEAGLDVELPAISAFGSNLREAVKEGRIDIGYVEAAVKRVLHAKFQLGLFENPYPLLNNIEKEHATDASKELSLRLAAESIVLLKNEGNLLPLNPNMKRIAVIGPNAASVRSLFGGYTSAALAEMLLNASESGEPVMIGMSNEYIPKDNEKKARIEEILKGMFPGVKTILEAICEAVSENTEILYEEGCPIKGDAGNEGIAHAVELAKKADCAVIILGGKHGWGNECTSGEGIDSTHLGLFGMQEELVKRVHKTGTPIVLVHLDGRPLSSVWITENIPAILEAWAPGQEGARAIANILFGFENPGGKLPVTIARNAGQIPVYHNHHNGSGYSNQLRLIREGYINETSYPLFCFGHGLSFTNFEYGELEINTEKVDSTGTIDISFHVRNMGDRDGDEVVQVYVHDCLASVVRPVKELVGFQRVSLKADEGAELVFTINMKQLAFLNKDMKFVVEQGTMELLIGSSSEDIRLKGKFEIVNEVVLNSGDRIFFSQSTITREGSQDL